MRGGELSGRLESDLSEPSQCLRQKVESAKGAVRLLEWPVESPVCGWEPAAYEAESRHPAFTIKFDPLRYAGESLFERLKNEILPHEYAHALQMVEAGFSLPEEVYYRENPRGLVDLFTHPTVYRHQVEAGLSPRLLEEWMERDLRAVTPGVDPDRFMFWLNRILSGVELSIAREKIEAGCPKHLVEATSKILSIVSSAQGWLGHAKESAKAAKAYGEAREIWWHIRSTYYED